MKSKHKALLLSMCAVLLVAVSVFGTLAYLTDKDAVTNTFTVGSVGLKLDEADVKTDGTLESTYEKRVEENTYHLLPGHTYIKDPTVTVDAGSEDAYVRMMVKVEGIDSLKEAMPKEQFSTFYNGDLFLLEKLCLDESGTCTWDANIWKMQGYTQSADGKDGVYEFRYKEIVAKSEDDTVLPDLFTHITVPGEINNEQLAKLENVKIVVTAHAIQADGFEDDETGAWTAFGTQNP